MVSCPYGKCRCVNLCKRHCVRKAMDEDGWDLIEGQFVKREPPPKAPVTDG